MISNSHIAFFAFCALIFVFYVKKSVLFGDNVRMKCLEVKFVCSAITKPIRKKNLFKMRHTHLLKKTIVFRKSSRRHSLWEREREKDDDQVKKIKSTQKAGRSDTIEISKFVFIVVVVVTYSRCLGTRKLAANLFWQLHTHTHLESINWGDFLINSLQDMNKKKVFEISQSIDWMCVWVCLFSNIH